MGNMIHWRPNLRQRSSNPFRDFARIERALDGWFEDISNPALKGDEKQASFTPSCKVTESEEGFQLAFDLPGIKKEDVNIEIHEQELTISGERKESSSENKLTYHLTETSYGNFSRAFTLPKNVDTDKVKAKVEDGVLLLNIPKIAAEKPKQIQVK